MTTITLPGRRVVNDASRMGTKGGLSSRPLASADSCDRRPGSPTPPQCVRCELPMVPTRHKPAEGGVRHASLGLCIRCFSAVRREKAKALGIRSTPDSSRWMSLAKRVESILARCTEDENGCWIWSGADSGDGYGKARYQGTNHRVHRLTFAYFRADIPDGLVADHLCRVRLCCNPWHLELVSGAVNTKRGWAARRGVAS